MAAANPEVPDLAAMSKKEAVEWMQQHGSLAFLKKHKLGGDAARVAKSRKTNELAAAAKEIKEGNSFATEAEREADRLAEEMEKAKIAAEVVAAAPAAAEEEVAPDPDAPVLYKKSITKKGDKMNVVKKGDTVRIIYTGKLEDGTVFDSCWDKKGKKATPLTVKIGKGAVIRGWDEGIVGMCSGEKCTLTVQPEWAYGKKGVEGRVPPNSVLIFDIELVAIA